MVHPRCRPMRGNGHSRFRPEAGARRLHAWRIDHGSRPAPQPTFQTTTPMTTIPPPPPTAIRLNRFIADIGLGSRRDADDLIEAGRVTVNGRVAVIGATVA